MNIAKFCIASAVALIMGFALIAGPVSDVARAQGVASVDAGPSAGTLDAGTIVVTPGTTAAMPPDVNAPDPNTDTAGFIATLTKLWKGGALLPAILLGLFGAFRIASYRIAWLRDGKRAAWTAAATSSLAMLAVPASQGSTPTLGLFLSALLGAAMLVLHPTAKPGPDLKAVR